MITQLPQWPYASAEVDLEGNAALPATALPAHLLHAIPAGDPVAITYPYDTFLHMNPMLWQAEDGFDFRLLGGSPYRPNWAGHFHVGCGLDETPRSPTVFFANQGGLYGFGGLLGSVPAVRAPAGRRHPGHSDQVSRPFWSSSIASQTAAVRSCSSLLLHSAPPRFRRPFSPCGPSGTVGQVTRSSCHISSPTCSDRRRVLPLSGTAVLDADASAWQPVTRVEFLLTDENHLRTIISGGEPTYFGWFAEWNTSTIANGRYSLQSIAYDAEGASRLSPNSVPITIKNLQPG